MRGIAAVLAATWTLGSTAAAQTIVATPSVGSTSVSVAEPVRFWIDVHNSGTGTAHALRIAGVDAPGFTYQLNPPCACSTSACIESTSCRPLKANLSTGERFAVWGLLVATESHSNQAAWMLLRWEDGANKTQELAVPIGRFTATHPILQRLQAAVGFVRDIALPVALAAFGFWLHRWDRGRAERVSQEERRSARRQARGDQERAERLAEETQRHTEIAETWKEMLPLSHEYTIKYYMPVVAAAERTLKIARHARSLTPPDADHNKRAFYMWTVFWRRSRAQMDALNGFYFKDRCGEELAAALFARCHKIYFEDRPDSLKRRDAILSLLEPTGPQSRLSVFLETWSKEVDASSSLGQDVAAEFIAFESWLLTTECAAAHDVLEAFASITRLEMNRVYDSWYGKPERMTMKPEPLQMAREVLREAAGTGAVSVEELTAYLEGSGSARRETTTQQ